RIDMPRRETRPKVGLSPTSPTKAAGARIEPPASVASDSGTRPAATALAEPLDDPPHQRAGSCGLRAVPWCGLMPVVPAPISCRLDLPITTAPAALRRATTQASARGSGKSRAVPLLVGTPATSVLSLMRTGTPSSGDSGAPRRHL